MTQVSNDVEHASQPAVKVERPQVVKWALGLTTLVSVAYIAIDKLGPGLTPFAILMGVMVLMMGLILVAAVQHEAHAKPGPARLMTWTVSLMFTGAVAILVPILLFRWPPHLADMLMPEWQQHTLRGTPLAAYSFYPVVVDDSGNLSLDLIMFNEAVDYLHQTRDEKAASDLMYLGRGNNVERRLSADERIRLDALISAYQDVVNEGLYSERDRLFDTYKQIVDGIGRTFQGTGIEIVLHDTRDPLHSVVAVQNPITGRRVGWPTTNFGIELIRAYSTRQHLAGRSYIAYPLELSDGRQIKSTTIPIFDRSYGLIGFICVNVDISKIDPDQAAGTTQQFLRAFVQVWDDQGIDEILENTRR